MWLTVASAAAQASVPGPDAARVPDAAELAQTAASLASDDAQARHAAIESLSSLPSEALPAIRDRLARLRRARPAADDAEEALTEIRRAAGSRRADDLLDIAPGVEVALGTDRSQTMLRMAEPLLLLRSLERQGTTDALRLVPEVLRLDGDVWRMEGRRVTLRQGDRVAAAAIYARSADDNAEGRTWARWTTDRLDLDNPGALAQRMSGTELADVLTAYAATHTLSAIPVVASFIDADQRRLRDAAREALRGYRQNGIWVARETYETRVGQEPDLAWGWERTLDELYERLDSARAAHVHTALAEATSAIERGDHASARSALDAALVRSPELATLEAARLYASLALAEPDVASRDALLRRAIAIAPADAPEARAWQGRLAYDRATTGLGAGVLDADAFARAAAADPGCEDCVAMNATLMEQGRVETVDRTVPYAIAAALFALLGLILLTWTSARRGPAPSAPTSSAPTSSAPSRVALVAADDTLS